MKEDLRQFSVSGISHTKTYWNAPTCSFYTTKDCKKLPFLCQAQAAGTTSETQISIISRFYSVHYGQHSLQFISDHICGQNLDRQMRTLTSFVFNIGRKDLVNLVSNQVCAGNCARCAFKTYLKCCYDENRILQIWTILRHKHVVWTRVQN